LSASPLSVVIVIVSIVTIPMLVLFELGVCLFVSTLDALATDPIDRAGHTLVVVPSVPQICRLGLAPITATSSSLSRSCVGEMLVETFLAEVVHL
jgi:hypothetical protein